MTNHLATLPHPARRGLRHAFSLLVLLTLLCVVQTTRAQTSTSTFTVTATVLPSCTLAGGVPLAFGVVTPGVQQDGNVLISAICTVGTPYTIGLDAGTGTGATVAARRMTSGGDTLEYTLYQDAARTTPWGDGGAGGGTVGGTVSTGLLGLLCLQGNRAHTVYGRIPANQSVPAGTYLDQVTLTITY